MKTYHTHPTYCELLREIIYSSPNLHRLSEPELSRKAAKRLQNQLKQRLLVCEQEFVYSGANYLRTQVETVQQAYAAGEQIEFETIGPYLANYVNNGGVMTYDNLTPEDRIGLGLAAFFRSMFPKARLFSLCDEYNQITVGKAQGDEPPTPFSPEQKQAFLASFKELLTGIEAIPPAGVAGKDYLLQRESEQVVGAERLVAILRTGGYIEETKGALYFRNMAAENPLYQRFCLRTAGGRWLCEALDAAGFLRTGTIDNTVTHLVVLPEYMKAQQDRVWELVRPLGLRPQRYHNIFFDPTQSTQVIVESIARMFLHN